MLVRPCSQDSDLIRNDEDALRNGDKEEVRDDVAGIPRSEEEDHETLTQHAERNTNDERYYFEAASAMNDVAGQDREYHADHGIGLRVVARFLYAKALHDLQV